MSDTDQEAVPTHRPRRRLSRLLGAAALLCVLALYVVLMVWAARPKWYTYVSQPTVGAPPVALVLQVPVGWECREEPLKKDSRFDLIQVQVRRKPLTGFARWWSRYVLRLDTGPQSSERFEILLMTASSDILPFSSSRDGIQMTQELFATMGYRTIFRAIGHPLGPALEVIAERPGPGSIQGRTTVRYRRVDATCITFARQEPRLLTTIAALHRDAQLSTDRTQSIWREIVRSIRVIQK